MRALTTLAFVVALPAASFGQAPRGYADVSGGFAVTSDHTSSDVVGEAGVRIAKDLFVFGNVGQLHNLQPSTFQPAVDATTATLAAQGVSVTGSARQPAWYTMGGVKVAVPASRKLTPYVFGGAGLAHVTENATFTYSSGTLLGSTPVPGDDVTTEIMALGDFTRPPANNALMLSVGGGVEAPVAPHLVVDVGYRASRIATDTPFKEQSVTFGFGYKF